MTRFRLLSCWLAMLTSAACSGPAEEPQADPVTGLVGIRIGDPATLEGTWGTVVELATVLTVPVIGDRNAGSQQLWLHERVWNAERGVFEDSMRWCTLDVWEVEGEKLEIPDTTIARHPPLHFDSTMDAAQGTWRIAHILDLWGLRGMPDPAGTPLPNHTNWTEPPQRDWIFDEDEDGQPATTGITHGITGGEVRLVVRGQYALDGTVVAEDRVRGLVQLIELQQNAIDATNPLAKGESRVRQDAEALATWFEMVRMESGATCDDVKRAQAEGRIAKKRPF